MRDAFTRIDKKLLKKTTTLEKLNKYSKAVYIHYIFLKPYIKHISEETKKSQLKQILPEHRSDSPCTSEKNLDNAKTQTTLNNPVRDVEVSSTILDVDKEEVSNLETVSRAQKSQESQDVLDSQLTLQSSFDNSKNQSHFINPLTEPHVSFEILHQKQKELNMEVDKNASNLQPISQPHAFKEDSSSENLLINDNTNEKENSDNNLIQLVENLTYKLECKKSDDILISKAKIITENLQEVPKALQVNCYREICEIFKKYLQKNKK